jgi:hypothetical protein
MPFGITWNSPGTRARTNAAARSETAMRASIRRATRRSSGAARSKSRERSAPAWNVATTGASEASTAHIEVFGASGSCAWTTSGPKARSAAPTLRTCQGSGSMGARDPL